MLLDLSSLSETTRTLLEVLGYIGSAVCVASFAMTSVRKLRIINATGAVLSTIYALLIWALPIALMNIIIAVLDFIQLYRMNHVKEAFEIVPVTKEDSYFKWFVERYSSDLKKIDDESSFVEAQHIFYYVRDNEVAGIFAYNEDEAGCATILLDYVIPRYRDYRIGEYFFGHLNPFKDAGINEFVAKTRDPGHAAYLKHVGFDQKGSSEWTKVCN